MSTTNMDNKSNNPNISYERWMQAQGAESSNWNVAIAVNDVEQQRDYSVKNYLRGLHLKEHQDLQGKRILDIGGGYSSILPRFTNFGTSKIVDPINIHTSVVQYYKSLGIEFVQQMAENYLKETTDQFDEIWMYNVLSHVYDPDAILKLFYRVAPALRICEHLGEVINAAHPYSLTEEWLRNELMDISVTQKFYKASKPINNNIILFGGVFELKGEEL